MERRLAAIVSTDVVVYSRLMGADEAGTLARMKAHRVELWTPAIEKHGGRVVGTAGDSLLIEHASAVAAVESAIAVQVGMVEREIDVPENQKMRLRVGINIGEVIVDGDDIYGDGVNVAARLQEMATPGGISISRNVMEQVAGKLEAAFEDAGPHSMKNIAEPVHVWRWVAEGQATASRAGADGPLSLPDKPSIAVLPFDNMSADPEQEFFADGLSEDIIATLSKISNLFVIARNSSFVFKGRAVDVRQMARELGVRYVLEGSVRVAGKRLRVTAQLIDAVDGGHLWADRFDRQMDDIFDIQDEIMREIVTALRIKMSDGEQAQIWLRGTDNVNAWSNAMQGVDLALQGAANTVSEGRRLLERAIATDPEYAPAHAWIAFTYFLDGHFGYSDDPNGSLRQALEAANRALALDPGSVQGLMVKGAMEVQLELDANGIDTCRRAASLAPNDTVLKIILARTLANMGEMIEAEGLLREAMRLNPFCPIHYYGILANVLEMQGRDEEAMALLRRALAQNKDYFSWSGTV